MNLLQEFTPRKDTVPFEDNNNNKTPLLVDLKGHTVEELAKAANVSVDVIQAAIEQRQRLLEAEQKHEALKENTLAKDDFLQEDLDYLKAIQPSKKPIKKYKPYTSTKSVHKVGSYFIII